MSAAAYASPAGRLGLSGAVYGSPVPRPHISPSLPRGEFTGGSTRQRSLPSFYVGAGASPEPVGLEDSDSENSDATRPGAKKGPGSPKLTPPEPVYDQLLRRGKEYMQRREALQEEARRAEQNKMRSRPQISRYASKKNPSVPIVERCLSHAADRQAYIDEARAEAIDAEEAQLKAYTFHPTITRRGYKSKGRAHSVGAGDRRRNVVKRQSQINGPTPEDLAECHFSPQINKRSVLLAERQRKRLGVPQDSGPNHTHADSLWERDHMSRLRTAAKMMDDHRAVCPFSPETVRVRSITPPLAKRASPPRTRTPRPMLMGNVRLSPPRRRGGESPQRYSASPARPWQQERVPIPIRNGPLSPDEAAAVLAAQLGWNG